ncbi:SspB family protein [Parvularcula oceani]|uniref:SspB family protein n=1 Tax=Parvularcula oceani TaxID=1247963 RepID=UPI0004E1EAC2|nr:ClpXP protease specificity-enhancing factor SspB [Parvularcula oceani]
MENDDAELDYAYLTQEALRGVVREVLSVTAALGAPPGEHHFYVEFATTAPNVQISDRLRAQYPERMTIVLQHQFDDLDVDEEGFAVTLHFKGVPDRLVVPYAAVTQFADPSANFALQFAAPIEPAMPEGPGADVAPLRPVDQKDAGTGKDEEGSDEEGPDDDGPGGGGADVVSLDRFRKK